MAVTMLLSKAFLKASGSCPRLLLANSYRWYSAVTTKSTMKVQDHPAPHTGSIRVLLMNQPENLNALSRKFCTDLGSQIEEIQAQKSPSSGVRALIIASNLDNAFCAGADLKERRSMNPQDVEAFLTGVRKTFTDLEHLPIPTISAVASYALGGGLELALCTTLRVFASTAIVGLPETRLAIFPGAGGTYRLPTIIGLDRARDMILTGRRVSAIEASAMGVCNRLVEVSPEDGKQEGVARTKALDASLQLAREICSGGPIGVTQALRATNNWQKGEEGMLGPYEIVTKSDDRMEALRAFAERRKPAYKGQ